MTKRPALSVEEKESELNRYYNLVIAAINYMIENTKQLKTAEFDPITHLQSIKEEARIHREKGRISKLKSWFRDFSEMPRETGDLAFNTYIFEKTGYRVDIFKSYFQRIENIIAKGKITTERQCYEVDRMVDHLCQTEPVDEAKIETLNKLLSAYKPKIRKG